MYVCIVLINTYNYNLSYNGIKYINIKYYVS